MSRARSKRRACVSASVLMSASMRTSGASATHLCSAAGDDHIAVSEEVEQLIEPLRRFGLVSDDGRYLIDWQRTDVNALLPTSVGAAIMRGTVGRDEELHWLIPRWRAATVAETDRAASRTVLVAGEPGVGKTPSSPQRSLISSPTKADASSMPVVTRMRPRPMPARWISVLTQLLAGQLAP